MKAVKENKKKKWLMTGEMIREQLIKKIRKGRRVMKAVKENERVRRGENIKKHKGLALHR